MMISPDIIMLLLQNATITEQNMRVSILETSVLSKPEDLIMHDDDLVFLLPYEFYGLF